MLKSLGHAAERRYFGKSSAVDVRFFVVVFRLNISLAGEIDKHSRVAMAGGCIPPTGGHRP